MPNIRKKKLINNILLIIILLSLTSCNNKNKNKTSNSAGFSLNKNNYFYVSIWKNNRRINDYWLKFVTIQANFLFFNKI